MVLGSAGHASDHPREPEGEAGRRRERDRWLRRRLLQRQLHDGAALRISALTLQLGLLQHQTPTDGQAVQDCLGQLQHELQAVLDELREIAAKIYPTLLDEAGLGPALREMADKLQASITIVASEERFGPAAEGAAYFAVADCLAVRPGVRTVKVAVRRDYDDLVLMVCGVDPCRAAHIADRALPLGGSVNVIDGPDVVAEDRSVASTITARFPCE